MAEFKEVVSYLQGLAQFARRIARPDLPFACGLLAGFIRGLSMPSLGEALAEFAIRHTASWSLLRPEDWAGAMLITAGAVFAVLCLLLRGYKDKGIRRGRIMGATVKFISQAGTTTTQRETCNVIVAPRMIVNRSNPPPGHNYVCAPSTDRRVRLEWEPDKQIYRGTCDESAFHDDIVAAMSTSQEGNLAVVNFPGRHFVEVDIRNADGEIDCCSVAVCTGFRLRSDPERDGFQSVA